MVTSSPATEGEDAGPVLNRRKSGSSQARWVPGRGGDRKEKDLLGDRVLQMYLLGEGTRWPKVRVSLRSGSHRKSRSGIWRSDSRTHSQSPAPSQGYRDPQATLWPLQTAPPCQPSSRKETPLLSSPVNSLSGPQLLCGSQFTDGLLSPRGFRHLAKVTIRDPDLILKFSGLLAAPLPV